MHQKKVLLSILIVIGVCMSIAFAIPLALETKSIDTDDLPVEEGKKDPRQVNIQRRPDGTIVGSIAIANAVDAPGFDNSFAVSDTFEIGPNGFSSSFASAFDSDIGGNKMSFANSQAQSSRQDLFGGGGGLSAANAAASSFSNPLFSGSNAQANAFGSQFGGMNRLGK